MQKCCKQQLNHIQTPHETKYNTCWNKKVPQIQLVTHKNLQHFTILSASWFPYFCSACMTSYFVHSEVWSKSTCTNTSVLPCILTATNASWQCGALPLIQRTLLHSLLHPSDWTQSLGGKAKSYFESFIVYWTHFAPLTNTLNSAFSYTNVSLD